MSEDLGEGWPSYSTVRMQVHVSAMEDPVLEDIEIEIPVDFIGYAYRATPSLEPLNVEGQGRLLRFGKSGLDGSIVFNVETGEVVYIDAMKNASFVNSSIAQFSLCTERVLDRFPFYSRDSDDVDEWESAAQDVEDIIRGIDPGAYFDDGYWYDLRWDIAIGDFATEDVLSLVWSTEMAQRSAFDADFLRGGE